MTDDKDKALEEGYANLPADKELLKPSQYKFLEIKINYHRIIVPHKEGMLIMQNFRDAEEADHVGYGDEDAEGIIRPIGKDLISCRLITQEKYLNWKTRYILLGDAANE